MAKFLRLLSDDMVITAWFKWNLRQVLYLWFITSLQNVQKKTQATTKRQINIERLMIFFSWFCTHTIKITTSKNLAIFEQYKICHFAGSKNVGKIYFGEKELHVHNNGISIFYWDLVAIFRHFLASYCQTANEKLKWAPC